MQDSKTRWMSRILPAYQLRRLDLTISVFSLIPAGMEVRGSELRGKTQQNAPSVGFQSWFYQRIIRHGLIEWHYTHVSHNSTPDTV